MWGRLSSLPITNGRLSSLPITNGRLSTLPITNGRLSTLPITNGRLSTLPITNGRLESLPHYGVGIELGSTISMSPVGTTVGAPLLVVLPLFATLPLSSFVNVWP